MDCVHLSALREPHRWVRRIRISVYRRSASFYLLPGLKEVKPGEVFAEHDRAETRSHRRFRRDAMVLGDVVVTLYGKPRARIALRE